MGTKPKIASFEQTTKTLYSQRRRNELEIIYSTSSMGMCFMDTDLRYLRCNEKLAEINGISAADHIGRTLREIVPEIAETMEPVYRKIIETGEPVIDVEASMTVGTDSQKKRYFSACYYPVKSEDGVVCGVSSIVQDITARVEVDKALSESQGPYKQLVEYASDIIYRTDLEGYFTYINPIALRIMGYTEEEVLGEHFTKGVVQAYQRKMVTFYERQLRKQIQDTYYEYPVLTKEGAEIWLGQNVQLIWEKGQVAGFQAVARDITKRLEIKESLQVAYEQLENRVQERTKELTKVNVKLKDEIAERKRAEKFSKDSEARFRMIYENAPVLVDAFDDNGRCIMFNKECEKVFGWTAEEIISHENPLMLFYPDLEVQRQVVETVTSKPEKIFREWKPIRKDGSEVTCLWANFKLPDGLVINIGYDITERKMEHNALLESEHRLRQLVESTNAIPWEANAKTWQFTYVGPQAVRLLGYPVKQWYEKDFWADHIHPEDRDYTIEYCRDSSQYLDNYEFDYRMIKANGDVVWLHDIVKVDRKSGEVEILRGFMIDITEQKKVEKEMHMAEEEANTHRERLAHLVRVQTLGEMASGIAHEINQPLAAIDSYAQASRRHLQSGKANIGKAAELIEKISGQARRAGSVVSRLRAMMQNKISKPVALDINNLLEEAAEIAGIETKNNDCNLIFKYSRSLPRVICDEIQIQQVALNLISNAVEAMADITEDVEKNINVETRIKDDNYVEVCISDNGPGINVRDVNNIFEAFYTTKDSGLGMGLSICKSIIENHGGKLGYSQIKTGGSRFYFSLPVEK